MGENRGGVIFKATGGFYYVYDEASGAEIECRPRGIFRKEGRKPLVGDRVLYSRQEGDSGTVEELLPRKSELLRPPLANLDNMVVVLSVTDPAPNLLVVDKLICVLEYKGIEPLLAVTKADLRDPQDLSRLYREAGFEVFVTEEAGQTEALNRRLQGALSGFCGNSGVGKSSLLNAIDPGLGLPVGDTSKKLGRGRHTTRHVEIHRLPGGALVADTPGFTSLELVRVSDLGARDLAGCFREFAPYLGDCRFLDCTHRVEKGCGVLAAVAAGAIAPSRHESYRQLYDEMKDVKEWERRS